MYLPLANILHHKLGSLLNAVGIGIGICMLVTLTGLSRGSLYEIADRMESIDADLLIVPPGASGKTPTLSGIALSEKVAGLIERKFPDEVDQAVPVFIGSLRLAGQDHRVTGIAPEDWGRITGGTELLEGRLFDPDKRFATWLENTLLAPTDDDQPGEITSAALADPAHNGLEIVIDSRLAEAGGFTVGQTVRAGNHDWKIVGIAPAGVTTRIFMPLRTAQFLFGFGDITKCTMIFVKLKPGVDAGPAARAIRTQLDLDVSPLSAYRGQLVQKFGIMFTYVDVVNVIALGIAFLFVMITLYTMVLQRTREIAILKSCGASGAFILRQVVGESAILTAFGTGVGIAMSFAAAAAIEHFRPLLTVRISWRWISIAIAAAAAGSLIAALWPAWRATRVDMVEALSYE